MEGWKSRASQDPNKLDRAIKEDYLDYIHKLPVEEQKFVGSTQFFEDGTGQNAVRIDVNLDGIRWAHLLIYDSTNKRIKNIKYVRGHYRS